MNGFSSFNGQKPDQEDLSAYCSSPGEWEGYVPRLDLMKVLDASYKTKMPLMLLGEAGSGKTSLWQHFGHLKGLPVLTVSHDMGLKVRDLLGSLQLVNGQTVFQLGLLAKFLQHKSLVILDEITAIDGANAFLWHPILENRTCFIKEMHGGKGHTLIVHPECWIVAAGNPPNSKYLGTSKLNAAFAERFACLKVPPMGDKEQRLALDRCHDDRQLIEQVVKFGREALALIQAEGYRCTLSLRHLKHTLTLAQSGATWTQALDAGIFAPVWSMAGEQAEQALRGLAEAHFASVHAQALIEQKAGA